VEINGSSLNPLILSIIDIQVGNLVGNKSVVLHRAKVFGEILCPTPLVGIYREKEFTQIVIFHIPPSALKHPIFMDFILLSALLPSLVFPHYRREGRTIKRLIFPAQLCLLPYL